MNNDVRNSNMRRGGDPVSDCDFRSFGRSAKLGLARFGSHSFDGSVSIRFNPADLSKLIICVASAAMIFQTYVVAINPPGI